MKLEIYAVHDAAVGAFNRPLFFRSRGEAIRSFKDAVANPEMGFSAHAEHYSFFQLGTFDDSDGAVDRIVPDRVCGALDFIEPSQS